MFLHVSVILSTGGVPGQVPTQDQGRTRYTPRDQAHTPRTRYNPRSSYTPWTRYTPRTRYTHPGPGTPLPLGPGTPPRTRYTPPREQCVLGDTGNKRAVRILLECILVYQTFSGHTSEAKTGVMLTSSRYAFWWYCIHKEPLLLHWKFPNLELMPTSLVQICDNILSSLNSILIKNKIAFQ